MAESHDRYHVPLKYGPDTDSIFMVTDGWATGISGLVSQGKDCKNVRVAAFYSAKLNLAQQKLLQKCLLELSGTWIVTQFFWTFSSNSRKVDCRPAMATFILQLGWRPRRP